MISDLSLLNEECWSEPLAYSVTADLHCAASGTVKFGMKKLTAGNLYWGWTYFAMGSKVKSFREKVRGGKGKAYLDDYIKIAYAILKVRRFDNIQRAEGGDKLQAKIVVRR